MAFWFFLMATLWSWPLAADITLPSIIGDNMVFQRDTGLKFWGWADPGEKVTVSFALQTRSVKTGRDGKWVVRFDPFKAGGPYEIVVKGKNTVTLSNILIGDVWLCSGQSNMEVRVAHCLDADNEVAGALHRNLRLFQITNDLSPEIRDDCEGRWEVCRPSTIPQFSAAGYYFGRKIMEETDIPIGLINASWGGTTVEAWMSPGAKEISGEFRNLTEYWKPVLEKKPPEILTFYRGMAQWEEDVHYVEYVGKPLLPIYGTLPESPVKLSIVPQMPMWVYNAMIAPVVPFPVKGIIWYQGESNAGRAYQYRSLFPALIEDWRRLWGDADMPFIFVQLANFGKRDIEPQESAWAELREAQLMTLSVPNTAMAVAIDIGDADNIHPRNKQEVGRRLALGALKIAYGRDVVHSGPLYESMTVRDGRTYLRFTNTGSGLAVRVGRSLRGFAVAGEDRKFVWADALIRDDEVVVWSDAVSQPAAVRYGWGDNPDCTLCNREGLPASPFRTDDWPGITTDSSR